MVWAGLAIPIRVQKSTQLLQSIKWGDTVFVSLEEVYILHIMGTPPLTCSYPLIPRSAKEAHFVSEVQKGSGAVPPPFGVSCRQSIKKYLDGGCPDRPKAGISPGPRPVSRTAHSEEWANQGLL